MAAPRCIFCGHPDFDHFDRAIWGCHARVNDHGVFDVKIKSQELCLCAGYQGPGSESEPE